MVPRDVATLLWMANLACLELHPHPVRADDLDHPDELRIDLDRCPASNGRRCGRRAGGPRALADFGLVGWPKTSGSRGMHVIVRMERRWTFDQVRRAALAMARDVERRVPQLATSKWWKEERHGVFLDYNQNAKDRTVASAYSVRPTRTRASRRRWRGTRSPTAIRATSRSATMPQRFATIGDRHAEIDRHAGSLEALLELSARQERRAWETRRGRRITASRPAKDRASRHRRRRTPVHPLIEIGRSRDKASALAGVERWKSRHPEAAAHLQPADILVDAMRGRFRTWTRVRINLQHVPEDAAATGTARSGRERQRLGRDAGRPAAPKTFSSS